MASWLKDNPTQRIKLTVINVVHDFNQSAKMGYSNAAHTGTDKGYVNDWRNKFPGLDYARGFANNYADQYFFPDEQGATPFWWVLGPGNVFAYRGGGGDEWEACRDYILGRYTTGGLTAYTTQCAAPAVNVSVSSLTATVTVSSSESGVTLYYTTDGSVPSATSPVYAGPVTVRSSRLFRAQARKSGSFPSRVVIRKITAGTADETNVAPQATAYAWNNDYLTANLSNANRVARTGLNDNNATVDVRLITDARTHYADGDAAFKYAKWQGGGVVWNSMVENVVRFEYVQGSKTNDWWGGHGCYFWNVKLELTFDGTSWQEATNWGYMSEFPFASFYGPGTGDYAFPPTQIVPSRYDPVVFYLDRPTAIRGFRIMGGFNVLTGYDQPDYVNVRELRAYQSNSVAVAEPQTAQAQPVGASLGLRAAFKGTALALSFERDMSARLVRVADLSGRIVTQSRVAPGVAECDVDAVTFTHGSFIVSIEGAAGRQTVRVCR